MFEKYIEQILKIFRYVDSALITDEKGIIRYYYTGREDLNRLEKEQVIGCLLYTSPSPRALST